MRSKRYFLVILAVELVAIAIGAYLWSVHNSKPQSLSDAEQHAVSEAVAAFDPDADLDGTRAFVAKTDGPPATNTGQDTSPVTPADLQRMQVLINEQWPEWVVEYGTAEARSISLSNNEEDTVSVMFVFESPKQISAYRWQRPSVYCRKDDQTDWSCHPGQTESLFHWPGQSKPVLVDSRLDDSLVYLSLEHVESYGLLAGRPVFSVAKAADRRTILAIVPSPEVGLSHIDTSIFVLAVPGPSGSYTLRVLDDPPEIYRAMWGIE